MRLSVPEFLHRLVWLKTLYYVADDWRLGRRFSRGVRSTTSGTILKGKDVQESVGYIETEFRDYLEYGGVGLVELEGKRILVVGPGDNLGVGALFVSHGTSQVVCIDKYEPERDRTHLSKVYLALRERLDPGIRERFDGSFHGDLQGDWEYNPERLAYLTGTGLEDCGERFPPGHFDMVFSRAVFEHLYDPDRAFLAMDRLLAPGGKMAHKIDLRDHEMFSAGTNHPMTFLIFPGWLWRRMTERSGKPNRRMYPYYVRKMKESGYDATLYITHVFGREGDLVPHPRSLREGVGYDESLLRVICGIRARLDREFQGYSDEELLISGIFLSARKPLPDTDSTTSSKSLS